MTKEKRDALLHNPAMVKIQSGVAAHWVDFLYTLAESAEQSNAAHAVCKFAFISDGESIDAKFVPEIAIGVRVPPEE